MGEQIAFENGRISDFQGLVTLTLTLDGVILQTVVHHSSTSTYTPNLIKIEETFCGRTYVQTGGRTFDLRPTLLGRVGRVDLTSSCHLVLTTTQAPYFHKLISVQHPCSTCTSSHQPFSATNIIISTNN